MEHALIKQQGYLLVIAIVLIVTMSFIGVLLTRMLTVQVRISTNSLQLKQAQKIALSGLDIAKRDVTIKEIECSMMSTTHNAESLLNGQFTVTGTETSASSALAGAITSSSSSIQLIDASGFAPIGVVKINNEQIYYAKVQGNILSELTRAKAGTVAAAHTLPSNVNQSQCYLSSTGAVPTMASTTAIKSTVSSIVLFNISLSLGAGGYSPSVASTDVISMQGTGSISNPSGSVVLNGDNFAGSTVLSTMEDGVQFQGNGHTAVNNSSGTLTNSSDKHDSLDDVVEGESLPIPLFQTYFGSTATPASVQALATTGGHYYASYDHAAINSITDEVIWVDGDAALDGDLTLGSAASPVAMVVNGDLEVGNGETLTIYGILYVMGSVTIAHGNASLQGEGSLGAEGPVTVGPGNASVSLSISGDSSTMNQLYTNLLPGAGALTYTTENMGIQAIYN